MARSSNVTVPEPLVSMPVVSRFLVATLVQASPALRYSVNSTSGKASPLVRPAKIFLTEIWPLWLDLNALSMRNERPLPLEVIVGV